MELVTSEQLKKIKSDNKVVLVDYFANWCGPCKMLMPRLEGLESQYPNVKFVKLNVDENMEHAMSENVRGIPTVIVFKEGVEYNRSSGANSDAFYKSILNEL